MLRRVLACAAALGLASVPALFASSVPAQAATGPNLVTLSADLVPGLSQLTPLGATAVSTHVEIAIPLADPEAAAEAAFLKELYTPGSAQYHHFLTPAEFAADFPVPSRTFEATLSFATAHGLSVIRTSATHDLIVLSGTVGQAERTFQVTIDNYTWHGFNFYANVNEPSVPAGLGIIGVIGLNTAQRMHTNHFAPATGAVHHVTPGQTDCVNGVCVGATTPQDLWGAYGQPASDMGQGQSVAIFGEGDWTPPLKDLRLFEAAHGLPAVPVRVVEVDGTQASYTDTSGDEEWDIDTQASTGMAPALHQLDLYFGTSLTDADVLNVVQTWADDPSGPLQASASYGECEYDPAAQQLPSGTDFAAGQAMTVAYEQAMAQANAEGRTLFSSAGDNGSSCPVTPVDTNGVAPQAFPDVNFPCSSPYVVCVGGTVLYTTGATPDARALETAWNYSGGGTSAIFPEPSYQQGITPGVLMCPYNDQGTPNTSPTPCRGVPDIAAQSGDILTNGYGIYYDGSATEAGGTSLSSPLSLGMWARVQAAAPSGGLGFANPTFYAHEADFYDIGNPQDTPPSPSTSNGYFASTPGWDYVSGLGVMDVTKLALAVDHTLTPTNDEASPNSATVTYYNGTNYQQIPAGGSSGSGSGSVDPACVPLFTGSPGESSYPPVAGTDYPNLDVLAGNMHNTASTLTTVLTVEDMTAWSPSSPPGGLANEYYMIWNYNGVTYYTNAQVAATGTTFSYGTETFTGSTGSYNAGTGTDVTGTIVDGTDGTITITIPLSYVGSPTVGASPATLTSPHSSVSVLVGTPDTGGLVETASTVGPQYNYTLDEVCAATGAPGSDGGAPTGGAVPEAPIAALLPVVGLAAAGGLVLLRRRRRAARTDLGT